MAADAAGRRACLRVGASRLERCPTDRAYVEPADLPPPTHRHCVGDSPGVFNLWRKRRRWRRSVVATGAFGRLTLPPWLEDLAARPAHRDPARHRAAQVDEKPPEGVEDLIVEPPKEAAPAKPEAVAENFPQLLRRWRPSGFSCTLERLERVHRSRVTPCALDVPLRPPVAEEGSVQDLERRQGTLLPIGVHGGGEPVEDSRLPHRYICGGL